MAILLLLANVATAQTVTVKEFQFEGNTRVSNEKLEAELDDLRGQSLTFPQLQSAADRLTDLYRKEGYFTVRAALPAQDVQDGVVKFNIVEAKLGEIKIQGNRYYSTEFLNWHLEPVTAEELPDRRLMQRQLLLLNEFPDLEVTSVVEAGEEPNTVDLVLDVALGEPPDLSGCGLRLGCEIWAAALRDVLDEHPWTVGLLAVALVSGTVTFAALFVWAGGLQFFLVNGSEMTNAFVYGGRYAATQPGTVWGRPLVVVFGFFFPMAFTAYLPAATLLGLDTFAGLPDWAGWLAPVAAVWAWVAAGLSWRTGVRHYQGAGG